MAIDAEHLSIHLFAIHTSFLVNGLFKSFLFLIELLFFLLTFWGFFIYPEQHFLPDVLF